MDIRQAVAEIAQKFTYRSDPKFLDYWTIMREQDGVLQGDCDDFALTSIWMACDENLFSFILNVMILHRYRLYFCKTATGESHMVGYAQGLWFDNWTREALPKEEFLARTGHRVLFFWPSPLMQVQLALGFLIRCRKNK
jgi:hypothetical protein